MFDTMENSEVGFSKRIEKHLEKYFAMHKDGNIPPRIYHRIIEEVERALFSVALKHSEGNHLKAAKMLGINRNTLRKKISILNENSPKA
ncbi:MAG: Fis family transcriptional regulator [Holosporaceae bacterium]|nr:Fis family transcriptional regulator [Holosporaceae bacterium]